MVLGAFVIRIIDLGLYLKESRAGYYTYLIELSGQRSPPLTKITCWQLALRAIYISSWNRSFSESKLTMLQLLQQPVLLHMDQNKNKEQDAENRMPNFFLEPLF